MMCRISFIFLWGFCLALLVGCRDQRKVSIEDLSVFRQRALGLSKQLNGQWQGQYQVVSPAYDTLFYESLQERLDYELTEELVDSSLVKSIILRDTFQLKKLEIHFESSNDTSLILNATFRFVEGDSVKKYPLDLNLSENWAKVHVFQFGSAIPSKPTNDDSLIYSIQMPVYESLQEAFSSDFFRLNLLLLKDDSLKLSLEGGYGKVFLKKAKQEL